VRVKRHFTDDVPVNELGLVTQLLALNVMLEAACSDRPVARDIAQAALEVELLTRHGAAVQMDSGPRSLVELSTGLKTAKENYSIALLRAAHCAESVGPRGSSADRSDKHSRHWSTEFGTGNSNCEPDTGDLPTIKRRTA
jgi:hypothetical protein